MATTTLLGLSLTLSPTALTALRLTPLLSTTASLTHAYMENLTTTSFLRTPPTHNALTYAMAKDQTSPPTTEDSAAVAAAKDVVVPIWFVNFFDRGVWSVIGLNAVTLVSAGVNLWVVGLPSRSRSHTANIKFFYTTGFALALAHYAFVPGVAGAVEGLYRLCIRGVKGEEVEEGKRGRAARLVREWVGWHRVRWGTVDLAAWACFLGAVVGVLTP